MIRLNIVCVCVCVCVLPESLPKPRQRMKPLPQRRAVSVHEDTLAMTQGERSWTVVTETALSALTSSTNTHGVLFLVSVYMCMYVCMRVCVC